MRQRGVVTTPEADEDAREIDEWWATNRQASPNLFVEELADAFALLAIEPGIGVRRANASIPGLRRFLLRSTRYHVYFVYTDDVVVIVSIWSAIRRSGPRLRERAVSTSAAMQSHGTDRH